jgi:excisionase family DNA binding protein
MSDNGERDVMNIDEAAALLGVSVKTFNKVLHTQSLPARKVGREWKFSRRALIEWVGSGRSDQFYREPGDLNGEPERTGDDGRRTSGWRVELD